MPWVKATDKGASFPLAPARKGIPGTQEILTSALLLGERVKSLRIAESGG
jgi:hypothetical protein